MCSSDLPEPGQADVGEGHPGRQVRLDGLVDVFAEPLAGARGFALEFHHTAVIVDDLAAVKTAAARLGLTPAIEAHLPTGMSFTYIRLPGLGHYVEHDQYEGDSRAFLDSVRTRPIGS